MFKYILNVYSYHNTSCNNIKILPKAWCESHICLQQFANDSERYTQPPENIERQDIPPISQCTDRLIRQGRMEFTMSVPILNFYCVN